MKHLLLLTSFAVFTLGPVAYAREYSKEELIQVTKSSSYDLKEGAEDVYQAKKDIQVKLGVILPHLNFGAVLAAVELNFVDLGTSIAGFLFPSNWSEWKASKLSLVGKKDRKSVV